MELGVELELDNRQFSLLRAEARSGSGLRRVGSCLTKFLNKRKAKLHFFQMALANFVDLRPFVGSHSTLPKRSCMVSGPVCFADLSLTASRGLLGPLCCPLHPTLPFSKGRKSCKSKF